MKAITSTCDGCKKHKRLGFLLRSRFPVLIKHANGRVNDIYDEFLLCRRCIVAVFAMGDIDHIYNVLAHDSDYYRAAAIQRVADALKGQAGYRGNLESLKAQVKQRSHRYGYWPTRKQVVKEMAEKLKHG